MPEESTIEAISAFSKGFVVCGTRGFFRVFERTEDRKEPYIQIKSFSAGDEALTSLTISPTDETVCCYSSSSNRLLSFPLGGIDILVSRLDLSALELQGLFY